MEEDPTSLPLTLKQRKVKGKVVIDIQKCKGCELCTATCKEQALSISESVNSKGYRYIIANNDLCTGCVNCALVCPDAVITVYRTKAKKEKIEMPREEALQLLQQKTTPNPTKTDCST
jgi:2-oxoglutarate ferredoxin oxidoreductase subunit delta